MNFKFSEMQRLTDVSATLSLHLDHVDILVPLPKPKFGESSLDTMVSTIYSAYFIRSVLRWLL